MSLAYIALNQILIMFLIIIIGFICYKFNLIEKETNKKLSNILLMLVSPLLIFISYQREFSSELLSGLLVSLLLAFLTHVFGIIAANVFLRDKENKDVVIERFSSIYSNCGFMGIPLINGILGSEGVFYITAYITVFNIFIWTHGLIMMIGKQDRKTMLKTLISPTLIAIFFGFIFFIAQIRVPVIMYQAMDYVASMNTPLAMIIAGVTIAQTNMKRVFIKFRIYLVVFVKLLFIPLILLLLYSRFPIYDSVLTTAVIAAACPTAATGTLFALRYNKNALYASEIFAITTLISIVTIPIVSAVMELLMN
jgi:hypothetical protein